MATPATRTPIRIARGTYTNLNASIADILDGEICWATDEDKIYVKDGGSLVATMLTSSDIGSTVQAYDATILKSADIGTSVQAYDADTAKLDVAQTYTAQQTFGELKETVYTFPSSSGILQVNPANGSIQRSVIYGTATYTDGLESGQTVVLLLENGASYTVNWPPITWVTSGGNVAPTLTAKDTLVFWKVSTTLYGAYVGSYV